MKYNFDNLFAGFDALIFFDTETTGLSSVNDRIIELAAICIDASGKALCMDDLIKLPEGETVPPEIVELTHITDEMLEKDGITAEKSSERFHKLVEGNGRKNVLLIAHNAQFDLTFLRRFLKGHKFNVKFSFLDTVTVYKDRAEYPHKLETAITHYGLDGCVQNSHRAIDDVKALVEVASAMNDERDDLHTYINLFGYNAKYGEPKEKISGITYLPQGFSKGLRDEGDTLPRHKK